MSYDDFEWLMNINFWGVVHGTKAFLPHLKAAGEGHVVNLSSVFGLISIPSQSAYNAAKFGVRGFTDALRMELEIERLRCVVHDDPPRRHQDEHRPQRPDGRRASRRLAGSAAAAHDEFDQVAMTSPEKAARQILAAVEARSTPSADRSRRQGASTSSRACRRGSTSGCWWLERSAAAELPRAHRSRGASW